MHAPPRPPRLHISSPPPPPLSSALRLCAKQMMRPAATTVSSSPARDKLPPTALARFLAGSGSRSRGRPARSSPLFSSRSKSVGRSSAATQAAMAAAAAGEEGEPTSPKVTCIGQVRIRSKKSSPAPAKMRPQPKETRPCQCFHKAMLCSLFGARKKANGSSGGAGRWLWRRCTAPLGGGRFGGYQRRGPDSPRAPPLEFIVIKGSDEEEADEEEETKTAAPPPKDALLLMRCRSAPHNRASSLATTTARCAVSPLPEPGPPATARVDDPEKARRCEPRKTKKAKKKKGSDGWSELAAAAAEDSSDDDEEEEEEEEEEETGSESQRPLVLPRSRSEPARRRRTA